MSPTHLSSHTVRSLLAELVAGRGVLSSGNTEFRLDSNDARRGLQWYIARPVKWGKSVQRDDVESIVDTALSNAALTPVVAAPITAIRPLRHLHIAAVRAHRFAGLHSYNTDLRQTDNFRLSIDRLLMSVQGRNGSGKTSLINAITWCLTGYVHRSQREPETTQTPLEIGVPNGDDSEQMRIPVVSPVPPSHALVNCGEPDRIPVDTWVELTVIDNDGNHAGTIRRSAMRTARGKLTEDFDDGGLGVDPIAYEIGTRLPGLIPYIQLGKRSEFGVAISMLTGLRPAQQLAHHAARVRGKLRGEFATERRKTIDIKKRTFEVELGEFHRFLSARSAVIDLDPSLDISTRTAISMARVKLEDQQARILAECALLGPFIDLNDQETRTNLLRSVEPAIDAISPKKLRLLASAAVMADLGKLSSEDLAAADALLEKTRTEAVVLAEIHADPPLASRMRLYARVAGWIQDEAKALDTHCPVCGSSLEGAVDPHTGKDVAQHIEACLERDHDALQKTVDAWEISAVQRLRSELPPIIVKHLDADMPASPHELLRRALTEELFAEECFSGSLASLKTTTTATYEREATRLPPYKPSEADFYPKTIGQLSKLKAMGNRIGAMIAFAHWRHINDAAWQSVFRATLGSSRNDAVQAEDGDAPLSRRLLAVRKQIEAAEPLTLGLERLAKLDAIAASIETETERLHAYERTWTALGEIVKLNRLIGGEIEDLLETLTTSAKEWKRQLYQAATTTAPTLANAGVGESGAMSMDVEMNGTMAPAQAVANASDLRASLVGFLFAFWEHIWTVRGGFSLLLLDDIQELFDRDNRRRIASAIPTIVKRGARVICTSNDQQFVRELTHTAASAIGRENFDRRLLHPVSAARPCVALGFFEEDVDEKRREFERLENENVDAPAVAYLEKLRVYLEQRLLDLFDDVIEGSLPTKPSLSSVRDAARGAANKGVEPFSLAAVRNFLEDPALQQGNPVLDLLNRSHHSAQEQITFGDVHALQVDLIRLREAAKVAFDAYQHWLRRDQQTATQSVLVSMPKPIDVAPFDLPIRWELAAFTADGPDFGQPMKDGGRLTNGWFSNKAAYRIRTAAFGFACPPGSLAIVELTDTGIADQRLVIALKGKRVFARRFLRNRADPTYVALGSEDQNPLKRADSLFVRADEVKLLKVVGVLFGEVNALTSEKGDAYEDDDSGALASIASVFRVEGHSALPLALPGQMVLGAATIDPRELRTMKNAIVAVDTTSGALLKRVAGINIDDRTILLEAIGGLGSSVVAHVEAPTWPSTLPVIKRARKVIGVLYDV